MRFSLVDPTKVKAFRFLYSLKSSRVLEIKNTYFIWLSHLFFYHFATMLHTLAKCKRGVLVKYEKYVNN